MVPDRVGRDSGEPWKATADDVSYFTAQMESELLLRSHVGCCVARHGKRNTDLWLWGTLTLHNKDERLFSLEQVETLRRLLSLIPIWLWLTSTKEYGMCQW